MFSTREAAQYLGVSGSYLRRIANNGDILSGSLSGYKFFYKKDLDQFQKKRMKCPQKLKSKEYLE